MRMLLCGLTAVAFIAPSGLIAADKPLEAAAANDDKLICKRFAQTGSLIKRRKVCLTASEWERVQIAQREGAERTIQGLSGGFRCGSISERAGQGGLDSGMQIGC